MHLGNTGNAAMGSSVAWCAQSSGAFSQLKGKADQAADNTQKVYSSTF